MGNRFSTVLGSDVRYETACAYLEALTRIEVKETPKGDVKCSITLNPPKCAFCEFRYKTYENLGNAASTVWNHVYGCSEDNLHIRGEGPKLQDDKMIYMDALSIIEARISKNG